MARYEFADVLEEFVRTIARGGVIRDSDKKKLESALNDSIIAHLSAVKKQDFANATLNQIRKNRRGY